MYVHYPYGYSSPGRDIIIFRESFHNWLWECVLFFSHTFTGREDVIPLLPVSHTIITLDFPRVKIMSLIGTCYNILHKLTNQERLEGETNLLLQKVVIIISYYLDAMCSSTTTVWKTSRLLSIKRNLLVEISLSYFMMKSFTIFAPLKTQEWNCRDSWCLKNDNVA